uniref:hypothetical protein n=1 Tax=Aeromonas sp. Ne-1 TaxID=1675689 RepID=UPI001565CFF6|nr:hypothetical protein [Aeromonas sp. Ne-1]
MDKTLTTIKEALTGHSMMFKGLSFLNQDSDIMTFKTFSESLGEELFLYLDCNSGDIVCSFTDKNIGIYLTKIQMNERT